MQFDVIQMRILLLSAHIQKRSMSEFMRVNCAYVFSNPETWLRSRK